MEKIHIGALPPPLGGISIYLYRLQKYSNTDTVVDEIQLNKIQFVKLLLKKNKHFVYHSPNLIRRLLVYLFSSIMGNQFTIVSHGDGLKNSYINSNMFIKYLIKRMLKKATSIQTVNHKIADFLVQVLNIEKDKIYTQHAFLPPPLEDEKAILSTYEKELLDFVEQNRPLIIANASSIAWYKEQDLYGLDMCVQLVDNLKKEYPNIGLVFALANIGDEAYYQKIGLKIKQLKLEQSVYFMTGQKELWPLFKKANVMVRPTCSDGYGISIAEALYFKCPAVASDVCDRPEGTVLFENRDQNGFYDKVREVLEK